ncbi:MAG TPA: flavin reductase family protein [Microbacteriaceae bacterium]
MPTDLSGFLDGVDRAIYIVTTAVDEERSGCLVGFVTQVSIDPPRLLVCLSVANHTYVVAQHASVLVVHLLGRDQGELAALFGSTTGDEIDKFQRCGWQRGPAGVPVLEGVPGWMVGSIVQRIPFGDHVGFILEPLEAHRHDTGVVLTFEQVKDLHPGHPA